MDPLLNSVQWETDFFNLAGRFVGGHRGGVTSVGGMMNAFKEHCKKKKAAANHSVPSVSVNSCWNTFCTRPIVFSMKINVARPRFLFKTWKILKFADGCEKK